MDLDLFQGDVSVVAVSKVFLIAHLVGVSITRCEILSCQLDNLVDQKKLHQTPRSWFLGVPKMDGNPEKGFLWEFIKHHNPPGEFEFENFAGDLFASIEEFWGKSKFWGSRGGRWANSTHQPIHYGFILTHYRDDHPSIYGVDRPWHQLK